MKSSFLFLVCFFNLVCASEILTVKEALYKVLEGLEIASLVEGILAVFFAVIVAYIVMKTHDASKENLRILQRFGSQNSQMHRHGNY